MTHVAYESVKAEESRPVGRKWNCDSLIGAGDVRESGPGIEIGAELNLVSDLVAAVKSEGGGGVRRKVQVDGVERRCFVGDKCSIHAANVDGFAIGRGGDGGDEGGFVGDDGDAVAGAGVPKFELID